MKFDVSLKTPAVERGGVVRGTAIAGGAARSRRVTARLYLEETIEGTTLRHVRELDPVTIHEGALARGQEVWFDLPLPEGTLPTYASKRARISWHVLVVADEPGLDSRGDAEFAVTPEARAAKRPDDLPTRLGVT